MKKYNLIKLSFIQPKYILSVFVKEKRKDQTKFCIAKIYSVCFCFFNPLIFKKERQRNWSPTLR